MPFVNADLLAKKLDSTHPKGASYQAAIIISQLRSELVKRGVSFCFETVQLNKIVSIIPRIKKNIQASLALADVVRLYDNSSHDTPFITIAEIMKGRYRQRVDDLPEWASEILADYLMPKIKY